MVDNKRDKIRNVAQGLLFVLLMVPLAAHGQISTASLTGVITDTSGAAIPNVQVTAVQIETNTGFQATTNSYGRYVFFNLPTGRYTVTAKYQGFKTIARTGVLLTVNQAANLNLTMPPGTTTTVVNVSAQAPLINATNSTIGTEITSKEVGDLPLNGRNYTQLLALTPGSTPIDVSQSNGWTLAPGESNNPTLQGGRNRSNYYVVDGAPNVDLSFNGVALSPPVDAIQEVKVEDQPTDLQFGGSSGGIINVTTKAGTDHFHGSFYDYLQNNALDSRNPFYPNVSVPDFHQNQFGFSFGGPVIFPKLYHPRTNKTWFFVAYEGFRHDSANTDLARVPTAAERQGDFSGTWVPGGVPIYAIYNPFTTVPDANNPGEYTRAQFPGNIIPSSKIDPVATAYIKEFYPLPNFNDPDKARSDNFEINLPQIYDTDNIDVRLDHNLTSRDHLSGHYMRFRGTISNPAISARPMSSDTQNPNDNITVEWDRTPTPTFFFAVQYSYMDVNYHQETSTAPDFVTLSNSTNPNAFPMPSIMANYLPSYSLGSYDVPFSQGLGEFATWNHTIAANAQKIWEKHDLKFGFNLLHSHFLYGDFGNTLSFGLSPTQNLESPTDTGDSIAAFLLGLPTSANRTLGAGFLSFLGDVYGAYAQDSWKLNRKLTINYGMRYDYRGDYTSSSTLGAFNMITGGWWLDGPTNIPNALFTGPNTHKGIINPDYTLFSPHVGAAYLLKPGTVIRSGFGIFYDLISAWAQAGESNVWPTLMHQTTTLNNPYPTVGMEEPFLGLPSWGAQSPFPSSGWNMNPFEPTPYVQEWNLSVEHSFSDTNLLTLTYVGSRGVHLDCCGLVNMARTPQVGVPEDQILNSSHVPWPQMEVFRTNLGDGWSSYNAFEINFQRRFSKDLSLLANYTWSHSLDDSCSGSFGVEGCFITQPYNPGADYGNSAYDLPSVFNVAFNYELPIGQGQMLSFPNRPLNSLLGGWQLSGALSLRSGDPLSIYQGIAFDRANVGDNSDETPNRVCNGNLSNPTAAQWFNTSCFVLPPQYTYGTAGRSILRGPAGPGTYNFSFMKNFSIPERLNLQYRVDFFNAFNLAYPGDPDTTLGDSSFGRVTGGSGGRTIQMALRLTF